MCRARPLQATGPETAMQEKKHCNAGKKIALQETGPKLQCNFFVLPLSRKIKTKHKNCNAGKRKLQCREKKTAMQTKKNCNAFFANFWPRGASMGLQVHQKVLGAARDSRACNWRCPSGFFSKFTPIDSTRAGNYVRNCRRILLGIHAEMRTPGRSHFSTLLAPSL